MDPYYQIVKSPLSIVIVKRSLFDMLTSIVVYYDGLHYNPPSPNGEIYAIPPKM